MKTHVSALAKKLLALFAVSTLAAAPAWAATKTVTLSVPGMTCAACPFTVKTALAKVAGVSKIAVNFDAREAIVSFDDTRTSVPALTKATGNAGYPSTLKNGS